jgi:hypothetical protein
VPTAGREPVDVTIAVKPLDGDQNATLTGTPDTVHLTPTRGADWLHQVIVEIRPDRVVVAIVPTDPHSPINKTTVRADGSAVFTT